MKTKGQQLYEIQCPKTIRVIPAGRAFSSADDVIVVPNPVHHPDWKFLTADCKAKWESYAVGHNLVSGV